MPHKVAALGDGEVLVLENLRFNPGETSKNEAERTAFAGELGEFADSVVSDGFGVVHRKQASVYELEQLRPSVAGLLIAAELDVLDRLTENPERPYVVVLGGSKVSDKLGVIEHLLPRVDALLIGGGMLFTFLAAQGHKVGSSLLEEDQVDTVKGYLADAAERGVDIVLDRRRRRLVLGRRRAPGHGGRRDRETPFGASGLGLDIGPTRGRVRRADPRREDGVLERPHGRVRARAVRRGHAGRRIRPHRGRRTQRRRRRRLGRGVRQLGFEEDAGHISTGGGASLEFLEGKKLPGLEVLGWQ